MKVLSEMRFAALAASDARVASLELRLGEVSRSLIEAEQKLSQRELHARSLTDVLGGVRSERQSAEARVAELEAQLAAEAHRAEQLAQELVAARQQQDGDLSQLKTLMVKMNVNEAALEESAGANWTRSRGAIIWPNAPGKPRRSSKIMRVCAQSIPRRKARSTSHAGGAKNWRTRSPRQTAAATRPKFRRAATATTMRLCARASAKSVPPSSAKYGPMAMVRRLRARRGLRQFPDC